MLRTRHNAQQVVVRLGLYRRAGYVRMHPITDGLTSATHMPALCHMLQLQVVAGLLQVLAPHWNELTTSYTPFHASTPTSGGDDHQHFFDFAGGFDRHNKPLWQLEKLQPDLAILVALEHHAESIATYLKRAQPRAVVVIVQRAEQGVPRSMAFGTRNLSKVIATPTLHKQMFVAGLSPHIVQALKLQARDHKQDMQPFWWLAVMPYRHNTLSQLPHGWRANETFAQLYHTQALHLLPDQLVQSQVCMNPGPALKPGCLHGFALLANFEASRRTFRSLWQQLAQHMRLPLSGDRHLRVLLAGNRIPDGNNGSSAHKPLAAGHALTVNVLGSSTDLHGFSAILPAALQHIITIQKRMPMVKYLETIQRSQALLAIISGSSLHSSWMSGTVMASLITGTPMIMSPRALRDYSFLTEEAVFLQVCSMQAVCGLHGRWRGAARSDRMNIIY